MVLIMYYITSNVPMLLFLFLGTFLIGFALAYSTRFYNQEGRKKGFKTGRFYGRYAAIDKTLEDDYKKARDDAESYDDGLEQHANKKWK